MRWPLQCTPIAAAQMDDALYATAPPESMAAIIFRDPTRIREALTILKPTAGVLKDLGIVDTVLQSPKDVTDVEGFARSVESYVEKSVKDLSKAKMAKLRTERLERAGAFGLPVARENKSVPVRARLSQVLHLPPLTPLRKKTMEEPPPDIKVFSIDDVALQVHYDYGDGIWNRQDKEFVKCGETNAKGGGEEGCGQISSLNEYLNNFCVCPHCGRTRVMGALGWIGCLADSNSFHELYRDLTVDDLLPDFLLTPEYKKFVAAQARRTHFREALVTGEARVYGHEVVLAVCEFYFSGGSMGVVFGEKFHRAAEYAVEKNLPMISLCCSGGARLYEGTTALMQMVKTIAAVKLLKENGLPFISVLADPATGGAIAGYAALGDVIIAEPQAMVVFSGPRVMMSRGFSVDDDAIRASSLHKMSADIFERLDYFGDIRGIHELAERKDMRRTLCKYLEFYKASAGTTQGR